VKLGNSKPHGYEWAVALLLFLGCVAAAAATNTSCTRPRLEREKTMTSTGEEEGGGAVIYTALGDSTGVGVGAREGGGYVARLFERIRRERPRSSVNNLCVSGATTEDVLRGQLRQAIATRPTLVTLGIGINDIGHGMSADRFARNYEEIIKSLRSETKATIVVTNIPDISFAPVVPLTAREHTRRNVELFNERVHDIAERYGLSVVDVYTETHRAIPAHPEFFSEDGFHPSAEGYEYWAKTMWPQIRAALGE
jgi:lysophospholipase L1-like esterase